MLASGPYPFQLTSYCSWASFTLMASTRATKYRCAPFLFFPPLRTATTTSLAVSSASVGFSGGISCSVMVGSASSGPVKSTEAAESAGDTGGSSSVDCG